MLYSSDLQADPVLLLCEGGFSLIATWGSTLIALRDHSLFAIGLLPTSCHLQTPL